MLLESQIYFRAIFFVHHAFGEFILIQNTCNLDSFSTDKPDIQSSASRRQAQLSIIGITPTSSTFNHRHHADKLYFLIIGIPPTVVSLLFVHIAKVATKKTYRQKTTSRNL